MNPDLLPVPAAVVTLTLPLAPLPTVAVICVAEFTVKSFASVLPNLTEVAPVKLVPLIITESQLPADLGKKEFIVGAVVVVEPVPKVKPDSVTSPTTVTTLISPVSPLPTTAVNFVEESRVTLLASIVPKYTFVPVVKLVPLIVIGVLLLPDSGEKDSMVGISPYIKPLVRVAVAP